MGWLLIIDGSCSLGGPRDDGRKKKAAWKAGKKNHACLAKGDVSGRTSPTGWKWTLRVEISRHLSKGSGCCPRTGLFLSSKGDVIDPLGTGVNLQGPSVIQPPTSSHIFILMSRTTFHSAQKSSLLRPSHAGMFLLARAVDNANCDRERPWNRRFLVPALRHSGVVFLQESWGFSRACIFLYARIPSTT